MPAAATALLKNIKNFDPKNPQAGRKDVAEALAALGYDLASFIHTFMLSSKEHFKFMHNSQHITNQVRDGHIVVKSRGCLTELVSGVPDYEPFQDEDSPGLQPGVTFAPAQPSASPFTGDHQGSTVPYDRRDPSSAREKRQAQGVQADQRLTSLVTSKTRYFYAAFSRDRYPFGTALECPYRASSRTFVFEVLRQFYPKHLLEGLVYGDVNAALVKTAEVLFNDNPKYKASLQQQLTSMRLPRGVKFEKAIEKLWDLVAEVESLQIPVIAGLVGDQLDNRKKDMLYMFIADNPDYKIVIDDYSRYRCTYGEMYEQCTGVQRDLDLVQMTGGAHVQQAEVAHTAQDTKVRAMRATAKEKELGRQTGWDPDNCDAYCRHCVLGKRATEVERVNGECFIFQLTGRCPFGDDCKFQHIAKSGKVVTSGVQSDVSKTFVCSHCKAVGEHWSFHCENKPTPARGGGAARGRRPPAG